MEDSFAKVMSLAAFIVLGHLLRRFNILKDQAFAAISALVMNVTLPCVILTNLNGVRIEGDMLLIAGLGFLTNIIFLVWGLFLSRNIADTQWRDFVRLNVGGYSVGPFAVPYVQSFFPTTGLMATCMFDVGNCVMAGGGTFAVIAGTRVKTTLWKSEEGRVSVLHFTAFRTSGLQARSAPSSVSSSSRTQDARASPAPRRVRRRCRRQPPA